MIKPELRKSGSNSGSCPAGRTTASSVLDAVRLSPSDFGLRNSFGFRPSGFGFLPLFAAFLLCGLSLFAGESPFVGTPTGRILAAGDRRVMILAPTGEVLWQYPTKLTHDTWMLASGNVLFADGETVTEVTPDKKVVFQYKATEKRGGGTYSCQRLTNGNTMIGENSTGRILEVDASGQIIFSLQTQPSQVGEHHNLRMVRKLANGNYLACHSGARLVKEYTPQGQVVWQVKAPGGLAFAALRTPQGTTLVSSLDQITEYDAQGAKVWEFACKDVAPLVLQNLTGLHWLANGHIVSSCYQAYHGGAGCGLVEISRDGKLAWRYSNPKADGTMMAVELLSQGGQPLPGSCFR